MIGTKINTMNAAALRDMFLYVARQIVASEDYLTEIDIKIGDGDHGTGMSLGFREVIKQLDENKTLHAAEDVFHLVGMTLLDTMGGASGVLFGTVFISGIVKRDPHPALSLLDFAEIFRASLDALKKRGKASIGDKTMVDALEPAVIGLEASAARKDGLVEGLKTAADRAKAGMEYTKQCVAKFGRAKSYGTASLGLQDAGATSVWIIFRSMAEWAETHLQ